MKTGCVNVRYVPKMAFRFDPSLHLSEGVKVREVLTSLPYDIKKLSEVTERIFTGNIFSRIWVKDKEHGVPYLSASDTTLANIETGMYLAHRQAKIMPELILDSGWILVTCSGTLGNTSYTTDDFKGRMASHDLIRVIPNETKYPGGALYAFISSKFGYYQITQSQFGGVVKHINSEQAGNLIVPIFSESFLNNIDSLIKKSRQLREESNAALRLAIDYFNVKYPIKTKNTKFFTKNISSLRHNFAAYNNNLEVDNFISLYYSNSLKLGKEASEIFAPPLFKHIYLTKDNGHPFVTGGELTSFNQKIYRWLSPRGVRNINDYIVREGTLLLYKSGSLNGMIGNTYIVDKQLNGCCLSDHVIRIVMRDKSLAYWTFAFLKSKGGIQMLKRLATGTAIPFITPEYMEGVAIPKPDEKFEDIVQLISEYLSKYSESKHLESKAISLVETEIEKWAKV